MRTACSMRRVRGEQSHTQLEKCCNTAHNSLSRSTGAPFLDKYLKVFDTGLVPHHIVLYVRAWGKRWQASRKYLGRSRRRRALGGTSTPTPVRLLNSWGGGITMDTTDAPQMMEHIHKSITFTPNDTRWVPCSARFVVTGIHPRGKGALLVRGEGTNARRTCRAIMPFCGRVCSGVLRVCSLRHILP